MLTSITTSNPPSLQLVTTLQVFIGAPLEMGESLGISRRIIPITGGSFEGPLLKGEVLPGGADWQFTRPDKVTVLQALYTLKTADGQLISVSNTGFRHGQPGLNKRLLAGEPVPPSAYYFMTTPKFECAAPELQWLTKNIFLGAAERLVDRVTVTVWKVGDEPKFI